MVMSSPKNSENGDVMTKNSENDDVIARKWSFLVIGAEGAENFFGPIPNFGLGGGRFLV